MALSRQIARTRSCLPSPVTSAGRRYRTSSLPPFTSCFRRHPNTSCRRSTPACVTTLGRRPKRILPSAISFCRTRARLIPLLETRITQTNEVGRCSFLLPAFTAVHQSADGGPLALVDVGCSAGLHLRWDRYYYDYGVAQVGDPRAAVSIRCESARPRHAAAAAELSPSAVSGSESISTQSTCAIRSSGAGSTR